MTASDIRKADLWSKEARPSQSKSFVLSLVTPRPLRSASRPSNSILFNLSPLAAPKHQPAHDARSHRPGSELQALLC